MGYFSCLRYCFQANSSIVISSDCPGSMDSIIITGFENSMKY